MVTVAIGGCAHDPAPREEHPPQIVVPTSVAPPPGTTASGDGGHDDTRPSASATPDDAGVPANDASASADADAIERWKAGERVTIRGRVSKTPWQHMMTGVPGKRDAYFDLESGNQTVVYWKAPPKDCEGGLIEISGTAMVLVGPGKKPGAKPSKADKAWHEFQVDVDTARCVP